MKLMEAKEKASLIFKQELEFETRGQIKYIYRKPNEGEDITYNDNGTVTCRDGVKKFENGRILLGGGTSWLQAMRQATKERLTELEKKEIEQRVKNQQAEREAQIYASKFSDFLLEKFGAEFEASLKADEPETSPSVP